MKITPEQVQQIATDVAGQQANIHKRPIWEFGTRTLEQFAKAILARGVLPDCGACPGDGSICPKTCRVAEESPPVPSAQPTVRLTDEQKAELLDWVSACQSAYHIENTSNHRFGGLSSQLQENRDALIEYVEDMLAAAPVIAQPATMGPVDANDLEKMATAHPDECFLKGSGVLKLIGAIRTLEQRAAPIAPPAAAEQSAADRMMKCPICDYDISVSPSAPAGKQGVPS